MAVRIRAELKIRIGNKKKFLIFQGFQTVLDSLHAPEMTTGNDATAASKATGSDVSAANKSSAKRESNAALTPLPVSLASYTFKSI
jgi:hypothetical protein